MRNLLSKIFKSGDEYGQIKLGERFDVYIPASKINQEIKIDKYVLLDGIKGMFKIEGVKELESSEYKINLVRENYPKNYSGDIGRIDDYKTGDSSEK